jgi:hypothetical protein
LQLTETSSQGITQQKPAHQETCSKACNTAQKIVQQETRNCFNTKDATRNCATQLTRKLAAKRATSQLTRNHATKASSLSPGIMQQARAQAREQSKPQPRKPVIKYNHVAIQLAASNDESV